MVLLVDDDPVQLRIREAILRAADFSVTIATTAQGALALLRSPVGAEITTIITDHSMPEMSGSAFVRELRQSGIDTPVIVLSGAADVETEYAGLGVIFRMKPCPPPELIRLAGHSSPRRDRAA